MDLLYLAQWVGCLAALTGGTAVLWLADQVPARSHPLRWAGTALTVLLLVAVLGLWLATAGDAAAPTLVDRAARLSDGVHLVALTFLVLFHTVAAPGALPRWYARGASLLAVGFGVVLSTGAQVSFPAAPWSGSAWLQLGFFVLAGAAMHCAFGAREKESVLGARQESLRSH